MARVWKSVRRVSAVCALGVGACSLSSLDDLKSDGHSAKDAGTHDAHDSAPDVDAAHDADAGDAASCDANFSADPNNCGHCGTKCASGETCQDGGCAPCDSATTDCDGDGWLVSEGDCCDKPGACATDPELVNPGAIEITGNGLDDNCNGKTDLFDIQDTVACDSGLYSNTTTAENYAHALGICRSTTETPATPQERTWGLISAALVRADGSPLQDFTACSIRTTFGAVSPKTTEGAAVVVISTGIASDAVQTDPGPNGGAPAGPNVTNFHNPPSLVDLSTCTAADCISDWLAAANPPLKDAGQLPTAPDCAPGTADPKQVFDSVMLELRLRAPTNMKSLSFNTFFLSAEYPEFVCSSYNDQFIALIDTPSGTPQPIPNPIDKNLLTYGKGGQKWPVGINIAHGTSLFSVCDTEAANPTCWDTDVDPASCSLGSFELVGTGFEAPTTNPCLIGGGTGWLTAGGNVIPGQIVVLRILLWDVGDASYDSTALIDGFKWQKDPVQPGVN